ncbi:hypothetical protein Q3G72_010779 [Acer saccharum]|nr:hypothetical protein Q3G72_010779 [Acer saccharum]
MEEDSIQYTAFSCCLGSYEWLVMPMGYKYAPSIFQRRMDSILGEFSDFCMVYIDNILIFSRTREDHLEHLKLVAQKLRDNGVILSKKKIELNRTEISFLGVELEKGRIILQPHVLEFLEKFPNEMPDQKTLQRFLGCINYATANHYQPHMGVLKAPLQEKLKKKKNNKTVWKWNPEDTNAVAAIKKACKQLSKIYGSPYQRRQADNWVFK